MKVLSKILILFMLLTPIQPSLAATSTTAPVVKTPALDIIPGQYWNPTTQQYEVSQGVGGAIYDQQLDYAANGTINTQNLNPTGTGTTNSFVGMSQLNNSSTISIHVTANTLNQPMTPQVSLDGINWVTLSSTAMANEGTGTTASTIPAATTGFYQVSVGGMAYFRIVELAACTGSATVYLQSSPAESGVAIDFPLPPGTNTIGNVSLAAGANFIGYTVLNASAGGTGYLISRTTTAGTTNATLVKSSGARLSGYAVTNTSATAFYLKLFNLSAAPTVGSSTVALTIYVPATSTIVQYFGDIGITFNTGISFDTTAAAADSDTAVITAGSFVQLFYQ